jgi:hypothetical protein
MDTFENINEYGLRDCLGKYLHLNTVVIHPSEPFLSSVAMDHFWAKMRKR